MSANEHAPHETERGALIDIVGSCRFEAGVEYHWRIVSSDDPMKLAMEIRRAGEMPSTPVPNRHERRKRRTEKRSRR